MRKIVQITSCGHNSSQFTNDAMKSSLATLFALCNDGTLWCLNSGDWNWYEVNEIPQNEDE